GTSMPLAMLVSLEIDISLRSARFRNPSPPKSRPSLPSFSGASAVAIVPPFSSLPSALFAPEAPEARERVLCAISIQSYQFRVVNDCDEPAFAGRLIRFPLVEILGEVAWQKIYWVTQP